MTKNIKLINDSFYVRVKHLDTGVETLYAKEGLVLQKSSAAQFSLTTSTYTGYYNYADVSSPTTSSLDDLLELLVAYVGPRSLSNPDAYGDLRTASKRVLIDVKSTFGLSTLRDSVSTTGSGTVTNALPEYKLSVGSSGGSATLRTVERGQYVTGGTAEAGIAVRLASTNSPLTGNQVLRVGYGDDTDGFFFTYDSTGPAVSVLKGGNENRIRQIDWNVDKLDGNGPSGAVLDLTQGVVHQILFAWYGYGTIEFRVAVAVQTGLQPIKQAVQTVHRFASQSHTSVSNPNLPLLVSLSNLSPTNAQAIDAYVAGRQFSLIVDDMQSNSRTTSAYVVSREIQQTQGFVPLFSVRRKPAFTGNAVRLRQIEFVTNQNIVFEVRLNAINTSSASFGGLNDTVQNETALEMDTSSSNVTGGVLLHAGIGMPGSKDVGRDFSINVDDGQIITICANSFEAAASVVTAVARFQEMW